MARFFETFDESRRPRREKEALQQLKQRPLKRKPAKTPPLGFTSIPRKPFFEDR